MRPGKPNRAASSFASGIIREPLAGVSAVCPVRPETILWLISPDQAIANIIHGYTIPAERLASRRAINLPGLSVSVGAMLDSLARVGGAAAASLVRVEPDPAIERLVATWPGDVEARFARELGFVADDDFDAVVAAHLRTAR